MLNCVNNGEESILVPCLDKEKNKHKPLSCLYAIEYQKVKTLYYNINATACVPIAGLFFLTQTQDLASFEI